MGSCAGLALEALVLAGGAGRRFGGGKLLAPWGEGRLIDAALAAAFAAPVRAVTVVTGADAGVASAARRFAERTGVAGRLRTTYAADHAEGMAATLRAGLRSLPADAQGVFVFLGDMPRIPVDVLPRLAAAVAAGARAAAPMFQGRRGHPVLFAASLFAALAGLAGDEGGRTILQTLGADLAPVEAPDDGVLFDVDRPDDLDP
jgi:molybdenum cofactor cytidylyltransferase